MKHLFVSVKLGGDDPSDDVLEAMIKDIQPYLSCYAKLSEPSIEGKYLYLKYEYCDTNWEHAANYVEGIIHGYLLAHGIEII